MIRKDKKRLVVGKMYKDLCENCRERNICEKNGNFHLVWATVNCAPPVRGSHWRLKSVGSLPSFCSTTAFTDEIDGEMTDEELLYAISISKYEFLRDILKRYFKDNDRIKNMKGENK